MIPFLEYEKVWGFPYLKIEKLPNFHFMFFARYEIHIQAFGDVVYGKFSIFRSSSPQIYFKCDRATPPRTRSASCSVAQVCLFRVFDDTCLACSPARSASRAGGVSRRLRRRAALRAAEGGGAALRAALRNSALSARAWTRCFW